MVSIDLFESKYLPKITMVLVDSFDPTSYDKSTISIKLIDSQFILGKWLRYMVSIHLLKSKYLPKIILVLVNSFDPTYMSEKNSPNKIYLMTVHVLTKLIKF